MTDTQRAVAIIADVTDDLERIAYDLQTTNLLRSREIASKVGYLRMALRLMGAVEIPEAR